MCSYSHTGIEYYRLKRQLIGEFGLWASVAGELNVPTIFLSGDDKACIEACQLVPHIQTVSVKTGTGWESADSLPPDQVHDKLKCGVQSALKKVQAHKILPVSVQHPVLLEICSKFWPKIAHVPKFARRTRLKSIEYSVDRMEDLLHYHIL